MRRSRGARSPDLHISLPGAHAEQKLGSLYCRPGARMPASKYSRQKPTRSSPGSGSRCPLGPVAFSSLPPSLSPFSLLTCLSLRSSLLSLPRLLFASSFLLLYSPPCRWLTRSPDPLSSFAPAMCPRLNLSPCRLSAFSLAVLKQGGSSASGDTPCAWGDCGVRGRPREN